MRPTSARPARLIDQPVGDDMSVALDQHDGACGERKPRRNDKGHRDGCPCHILQDDGSLTADFALLIRSRNTAAALAYDFQMAPRTNPTAAAKASVAIGWSLTDLSMAPSTLPATSPAPVSRSWSTASLSKPTSPHGGRSGNRRRSLRFGPAVLILRQRGGTQLSTASPPGTSCAECFDRICRERRRRGRSCSKEVGEDGVDP